MLANLSPHLAAQHAPLKAAHSERVRMLAGFIAVEALLGGEAVSALVEFRHIAEQINHTTSV
jgi:hypothetical protein